jgi:hypothetical protein
LSQDIADSVESRVAVRARSEEKHLNDSAAANLGVVHSQLPPQKLLLDVQGEVADLQGIKKRQLALKLPHQHQWCSDSGWTIWVGCQEGCTCLWTSPCQAFVHPYLSLTKFGCLLDDKALHPPVVSHMATDVPDGGNHTVQIHFGVQSTYFHCSGRNCCTPVLLMGRGVRAPGPS